MSPGSLAVVLTALVFLAAIVLRVTPWGRARRASSARLRDARAAVRLARTEPERAVALVAAARLAAAEHRPGAAAGLLARALKVDPASVLAVEEGARLLARRPAALERFLWRGLALPWDDAHAPAVRASAKALAELYRHRAGTRPRARALARLAHALPSPPPERPSEALGRGEA
jgi:hypothetical protein